MATRQLFSNELEGLRNDVLRMGRLVSEAIEKSVTALVTQDLALAQQIMDGDDEIDRMQIDIEDRCILLIARQQPMAKDLRILSTGLKIITDMERMGDHAFDIAKQVLAIGKRPLIKPLVDIPIMAQLAAAMLSDALEAYVRMDVALAEAVWRADDTLDAHYLAARDKLMQFVGAEVPPQDAQQAVQLLLVATYLERIGDHTTNIAEGVIYLETGQRVRTK